jgi:UDP-2,3-diacylglucosamine hydrolase
VAVYLASDVHLRLDCPERGRRFARFLAGLDPEQDTLAIVGDLCDFWFVARQRRNDPLVCTGLSTLADFRSRGGGVTILLGNHDGALGPFYQATLGLDLRDEPLDLMVYGLRVRLVHGHRLGLTRRWKSLMESTTFLRAFHAIPGFLAVPLDHLLHWTNVRNRGRVEGRYYAVFRRYAASCRDVADLVVVGHVHTPLDDSGLSPRLVVLGGWHNQASYLKIDASGASLVIETDDALIPH